MSNTLPLPEPWDYCYEWNGPFGTRKFSAASYNGNRPDRSVPIYTADQMHAHAAAVSAADNAALTAEVGKLKHQLWVQDACNGRMAGDPPRYTAECVVLRERVKVLEDALNAMLTHMGMDEDEWNKPTFDQARSALERKP